MKIDVLALGMLSAIRRTLELVSQQRGEPFEMQDIPAEDEATYDMICAADTVGVFQIESRAQMSMMPRLRPREFYDLVIEVAIVRPGPIQGGMVHPYLRRRQGLEPVSYPSPEVEQALSRTLGVPIFQEQVMQVAMLAAGFSAGEADQLRRAMAAWKRKGGPQHYHARIVEGMLSAATTASLPNQSLRRFRASANMVFPKATPQALRCSCTPVAGSSAMSQQRFCARCSTASRWVFIRRRNWSRMQSATASVCCPWT